MPLYEYACDRCGKTFEAMQKFSDEPLTVHEGCGGALERLISAPALQFKGSGWYVTDYGRNGKGSTEPGTKAKPDGKSESKSEGKSESKSGAKSESKTESKSESKPAPPSSAS